MSTIITVTYNKQSYDLEYSRNAVKAMEQQGFVVADGEGHLSLTAAGLAVAEKIYERHTLLTTLLVELGVSPQVASEDACKIEHHISDETFEALKRYKQNHR